MLDGESRISSPKENFMILQELMQQQKADLDITDAIVKAAENGKREMTAEEREKCDAAFTRIRERKPLIKAREAQNTIRRFMNGGIPTWVHDPQACSGKATESAQQRLMSTEYTEAFLAFVRSNGKHASSALSEGFDPLFGGFALPSFGGMSAALYEGSNSAGGYAVSVPTDPQIVPLALPDLGVRSVARILPTNNDIKIPTQASFSTAAIKAESGGSTNTFTESNPTLGQFTLSAFMIGLSHPVSWELLQDVNLFQQFGISDLLAAIAIKEDGYFVTGTGTGQPQGLVGNVGTGTGSAYAVEDTGAYLLDATDEVQSTLRGSYFGNAGWLMNRATGVAVKKAQRQANLFAPVWTRENGRDYLHGFPVTYSQNMPNIPTATTAGVTPMLFGSFPDGYVIGDRGGSGTFVKILDQPLALNGQTVLLAYKRVDGRVRSAEAIQGISISHS
jgi:HK97 family phage major capsid protein